MISKALIHYALAAFNVCAADAGDPRKAQQLETVAEAIAHVSRTDDEAAKLLAVGNHESRFCLRVHSGEHRGPGRGIWQLEGKSRSYAGPFVGLSQEATNNAARVALAVLRRSYQCGREPADVFTAYAGRTCDTEWPTLRSRVSSYWFARMKFAEFRKRESQ